MRFNPRAGSIPALGTTKQPRSSNTMPETTKILYIPKKKKLGVFITSTICLFILVNIRDSGTDDELMMIISIIFFGLGVLVSAILILPHSAYLKLTPEGFEVCSLFRKSFTKWDDIEKFLIYKNPTSPTTMVGLLFDKNYEQQETSRGIAKSLTGGEVEGALPDTYGMSAKNLTILMNEWLVRYKLS